MSRSKTLGK